MACGEGYGSNVLARTRRLGRRRRRQPAGPRARTPALPAGEPAFERDAGRILRESPPTRSCSCRRSSTCRTRRRCSRTSARWSASRRTRLRLDARTCSRSRRRASRGRATRGTCTSTAAPSSSSCAAREFSHVQMFGLFHARKLRAHELALRGRMGPGARRARPDRARSTTASLRRSASPDFALRPAGTANLDRALDFLAVCRP